MGVTGARAAEIVKKFIQDNPQQLQLGAEVIAFSALRQAFPCPKPVPALRANKRGYSGDGASAAPNDSVRGPSKLENLGDGTSPAPNE
jgi:hypothetical protein